MQAWLLRLPPQCGRSIFPQVQPKSPVVSLHDSQLWSPIQTCSFFFCSAASVCIITVPSSGGFHFTSLVEQHALPSARVFYIFLHLVIFIPFSNCFVDWPDWILSFTSKPDYIPRSPNLSEQIKYEIHMILVVVASISPPQSQRLSLKLFRPFQLTGAPFNIVFRSFE